ncbi:ABC transporter ATP-binding protein [Chitinivorax sp. B]|uniref:ABC transporter ATP-binding protein n=1 Tax=Chitinivorax sp. B TaxID=2502235 RepID=UPI0010F9F9A8|nr:ABC transporter ATP-binding protein [Chitinivorax sp. B]
MDNATLDKVIEFKGVTKRFKDLTAVNDVSLDIRRGEFVALLGPNGAGKTTLVEMIEGLKQPEAGSIRILGKTWAKDEAYLRMRLSGVLQETLFIGKLRVDETVNLFGSFYKRPRSRTDEVLELVELTSKRKALVEGLSGGQRQRLALAIAILNEPEIMILDEPTTGLDPQVRRGTWEILRRLNRETRSTMILTTHYMEEAEFLCDRICIMHQGRILTQGTLRELLQTHEPGEVVEYRVHNEQACAELRQNDNVISYSYDQVSAKARILVHNGSDFLFRLSEFVRERKIDIDEIIVRKKTLDDLFLSLAGRGFHE